MKLTKKLAGILLSAVLMFSMITPALAATIKNESGLNHDYAAYQILIGTQNESGKLGDIKWGDGVDNAALLADSKLVSLVGNVTTAANLAEKIAEFQNDSQSAKDFAKIVYSHIIAGKGIALDADEISVDSGYYLIVDESNLAGANDANNLALLQITDTITIKDKTGVATVEKKVNDGTGTYSDYADYRIGSEIEFQLTATLPDNLENFDEYTLGFHDNMNEALDFDSTSVSVTAANTKVDDDYYDVITNPTDGDTFEVLIDDAQILKDETGNSISLSAGDTIVVTYKATLNNKAAIGGAGNENTVVLEFSNNPNTDQTGKTNADKAVVFTYGLNVNKVDKDTNETLKNAQFKLADANGMYVIVDENNLVTDLTSDANSASVLTSDANGNFIIKGLDQGTYSLYEIQAPGGYNTPTVPFTLEITASGDVDTGLTALTIAVNSGTPADGNLTTGIVTATIENSKGSLLPTTGGIGTTVFYIAGAVIVIAAAIALIVVTKKRRNNSQSNG